MSWRQELTLLFPIRLLLGVQSTSPPPGFLVAPCGSAGLADWELDRLMWSRSVENVATATTTITSLAQLLDQIGNIVINDNIAQQVTHAKPDVDLCSFHHICREVKVKHVYAAEWSGKQKYLPLQARNLLIRAQCQAQWMYLLWTPSDTLHWLICLSGVKCSHVSAAGCGRAGGREPRLRPAVQQRGHLGVGASVLRPFPASPPLLPRWPEICHLHTTLPAHVCAYSAVTAQNSVRGEAETPGKTSKERLRNTGGQEDVMNKRCFEWPWHSGTKAAWSLSVFIVFFEESCSRF